jgi:hypothetical protein
MAEEKKRKPQGKKHKLLSIVRNPKLAGAKFGLLVQCPDGAKVFIQQARAQIESQVLNYEGRREPQCQAAHKLYSFCLAQFPGMIEDELTEANDDERDAYEKRAGEKMDELTDFATRCGMGDESLVCSETPADLWQVIFNESYYTTTRSILTLDE